MQSIEEILERVIVCPSGCWLWIGADSGDGKGRGRNYPKAKRWIGGVEVWFYVHRRAWELFNGKKLRRSQTVDHICKHWGWLPLAHRRCVNPEHLEAVSLKENIRRNYRGRDCT